MSERLMQAIAVIAPGGADMLQLRVHPEPTPGPGQVLIRVAAAGVNRPDILQRQGLYPPPPGASAIPGLEVAGTVVACADGVEGIGPGDAVCALVTGGGYAPLCVADASACLPVPERLDMVQAAALPEALFTVWHNVFQRGTLKSGETFLVHGGTSGIGTTAIQLARAFGARVFATAGSPEKCALCISLGAERAIDHTREDFVEAVREATAGRGADVILDMVGGDYIDRNIRAAAEEARIVQIAFLRGSRASADFMRLMLKRITLTGSTLRARPAAVKAEIARELRRRVWPLIETGEFAPVIDSTFPLAEARLAHERMESNRHMGKIVLIC